MPPLPGPPVCTAKLAKRVVWPEVPNVRLQTLARYFRTRVQPVHRALADAEATVEVLHGLLDLSGRLGISTLGDLHEACRARGRPHYGKIRLADHLPHAPGVYLFRGRDGRVLYVGKSKDLRARVKSYFYGDARKKVADLLAQVTAVEGVRCATELEALALEARLIGQHEPRYNRRGKTWRRYAYLKVDPREAFPRLRSCTARRRRASLPRAVRELRRRPAREGGPRGGRAIRRCTTAMAAGTRFAPCALADMGRCAAPCDGRVDPSATQSSPGTSSPPLPQAGRAPRSARGPYDRARRARARSRRPGSCETGCDRSPRSCSAAGRRRGWSRPAAWCS